VEKNVVANRKEKRGEGTTLLDTTMNRNGGDVDEAANQKDVDVGEEGFEHVREPSREAKLGDAGFDEVVVEGIEGLGGVEEKDVLLLFAREM
jgi:hypothetical protein